MADGERVAEPPTIGLQWPLPTEGLDMVRDIVSDRSAEQTTVRSAVQSKGVGSTL